MKYTGAQYSPSGMMSPLTVAYFIVAALLAAAVGVVYQYVLVYIPLIYLNLLAVMGLGFGIGTACAFAVKKGECRNRMVAALLTGLVAAAGLAASYWAVAHYIAGEALKQGADKDLVAAASIWDLLELRMQSGWNISNHGSSGSEFSGHFAVGAVWAVEALTILGIAGFLGIRAAGEPYCEKCSLWCEGTKLTLRGLTAKDAEDALSSGGLGAAIALKPPAEFDPNIGVELTTETCKRCTDTGFLTVSAFTMVQKKKNKPEAVRKFLVKHAVLRTDELAKMRDRIAGIEAVAAVAQTGTGA